MNYLEENLKQYLENESKLKTSSFTEMDGLKSKNNTISKVLNKIVLELVKFEIFITVEEIRSKKINVLNL